ncbi:RHS repeat domain-containing protein [Pirellulaceae bacterium SH449]
MSGYGFTSAGTSYDDEDRLTGYARASGTFTQAWNLTPVGDWNSITTNGTAQNRTHGPTHELLTAAGQNITTDVKGNITVLPANLTPQASPRGLQWDFDNKLKAADLGNNSSVDVEFQYDALGRRVARLGSSGSFVFVQHDQQTIADYGYGDAPSSPLYRYVYASYIDEPVVRKAAGTGGTIHYYHRNQQYSITAMTTSTGAVAERYAYTAYGQPTICNASGSVLTSSAVGNRYTYTGREWDETLGLHHFRARWMSPLAGRFLGRDPIGVYALHFNTFEFVRGNALRSLDPSGLYDFRVEPEHVNCAGFALGNGISIQPGGSVMSMATAMGFECHLGVSAVDCKSKCGDRECAQGYLYINKAISSQSMENLHQWLVYLCEQYKQQGKPCNGPDDFLRVHFFELQEWLMRLPWSPSPPSYVIDFHFLRCTGDVYTYQPCRAAKGSKNDKCDTPIPWDPKKDGPDYFNRPQLISRMCCCRPDIYFRPVMPTRY